MEELLRKVKEEAVMQKKRTEHAEALEGLRARAALKQERARERERDNKAARAQEIQEAIAAEKVRLGLL